LTDIAEFSELRGTHRILSRLKTLVPPHAMIEHPDLANRLGLHAGRAASHLAPQYFWIGTRPYSHGSRHILPRGITSALVSDWDRTMLAPYLSEPTGPNAIRAAVCEPFEHRDLRCAMRFDVANPDDWDTHPTRLSWTVVVFDRSSTPSAEKWVVTMVREVRNDDTDRYLYHDLMFKNEASRQRGLTAPMSASSRNVCDLLGLDMVRLTAGLRDGGHHWANEGFVPVDAGEWERLKPEIERNLKKLANENQRLAIEQQLTAHLESQDPMSIGFVRDIGRVPVVDRALKERLDTRRKWRQAQESGQVSAEIRVSDPSRRSGWRSMPIELDDPALWPPGRKAPLDVGAALLLGTRWRGIKPSNEL
jgi:hypothetical protein